MLNTSDIAQNIHPAIGVQRQLRNVLAALPCAEIDSLTHTAQLLADTRHAVSIHIRNKDFRPL